MNRSEHTPKASDGSAGRRLTVEYLPLSALAPDPKNPRVHKLEQVRAIARSIEVFGFNAPVLVDGQDRIVAGHGRLEAAKLVGLCEVPIVRLAHLSQQQAKAYLLADNKLTDRSAWNDEQLAFSLKELQELSLDFEIEATGFEIPEIDLRIQSLDLPEQADPADDFRVPEEVPVSKRGDIWRLGDHRLICGDALDPTTYVALLGTERAGCVFTDPPYNVRINGHAGGKGRLRHREFAMASGEMAAPEFQEFLVKSIALTRAHMATDAVGFLCMDWRHIQEAGAAISLNDCELINLCVWVKSNGGMGSLYRSAHELVFVFRGKGTQHRNNVQLGRFGRNRTNVWHYPGMNSFPRRGQAQGLALHPTVKPLAMVSDALLDVSRRSDIVLDPFCGSGTTILAAERTGRRGYGIELDALYVDVAVHRWQQMVGKEAVHASGQTFAQIRIQREGVGADE